MPDRRGHLEIAVDDADDRGPAERRPIEFPLPDRRTPIDIQPEIGPRTGRQ